MLGGTARALSGEREAELTFTADAPSQSGKCIKVPMPSRALPAEQVAEARGFADGFALRMRLHDAAVHTPRRAQGAGGARGVRRGSRPRGSRRWARRAMPESPAIWRMRWRCGCAPTRSRARRNREEVPLSTAIGLMVRERLTGRDSPASAALGMALVRDWIEEKAGGDLDALALAIDDQRAFATLTTRLLQDLELTEGEMLPDEGDDGGGETRGTDDKDEPGEDEGDGDTAQGQGEVEARGEQRDGEQSQEQGEDPSEAMDDGDGEPGDEGDDGMLPVRPTARGATCRPNSSTSPIRARSTRRSPPPTCATPRSSIGCAPTSTSSSSTSRAR